MAAALITGRAGVTVRYLKTGRGGYGGGESGSTPPYIFGLNVEEAVSVSPVPTLDNNATENGKSHLA